MVPKMWSGVPPEDLLIPEPALPSQFRDVWHRTRAISSEKSLVLSVLWQAVLDLRKHRYARRRQHQRLYMQAYEWVVADDRSWPFSFVNLCDMLDLNSDLVRAELLGDAEPQAVPAFLLGAMQEIEEAA